MPGPETNPGSGSRVRNHYVVYQVSDSSITGKEDFVAFSFSISLASVSKNQKMPVGRKGVCFLPLNAIV